jgi:hypothetical protein
VGGGLVSVSGAWWFGGLIRLDSDEGEVRLGKRYCFSPISRRMVMKALDELW